MNLDPTQMEDRLGIALRAVTPRTDPELVLDQVERRRSSRRRTIERRRRVRRSTAAASLAAACVVAVVVMVTGAGEEVRTVGPARVGRTASTTPDPTTGPDGQVDDVEGSSLSEPVELPGGGTRVTPLTGSPEGFWVARGEPLDGTRSLPDTITFIASDGSVGPSTEVRGAALVAVVDDDLLWVVVQETSDLAAPGALRLKRVDRSDGTLVASYDVPLGEVPVGLRVAADGVHVHGATRELVMDRLGALVEDRRPSGPATTGQVVESGGIRWSLDRSGTDSSAVEAGAARWDRPGVRRLASSSGTGPGDVLAEVVEGDRLVIVPLTMAGSGIVAGRPVARLAVTESVAAAGHERLWVLRGPTVVSVPVER